MLRLLPALIVFCLLSTPGRADGPAVQVSDRQLGAQGITLLGSVAIGDELLFVTRAGNESMSVEAWRSDGSVGGTRPLFETAGDPDARQIEVRDAIAWNGLALFLGYSHDLGWQLWRSDLTVGGTFPLGDFLPKAELRERPRMIAPAAAGVLMMAWDGSEQRLWTSDGTRSGTRIIGPDGVFQLLASDGSGHVYLARHTDDFPIELWVTDGTAGGTSQLPILTQSLPEVTAGETLAYYLAFAVDQTLVVWVTDGTAMGTRIAAESFPQDFVASREVWRDRLWVSLFGADGERVVSVSPDGGLREEPLLDLGDSPRVVAAIDDFLFVTAESGGSTHLYAYDGETVEEIFGGGPLEGLLRLDDRWFFRAQGDPAVWVTDGTMDGTGRWSDDSWNGNTGGLAAVEDRVFRISTFGLRAGPAEIGGGDFVADLTRPVGSMPRLLTPWSANELAWAEGSAPSRLRRSTAEPPATLPLPPAAAAGIRDLATVGDRLLALDTATDGTGVLQIRDRDGIVSEQTICGPGSKHFESLGARALIFCGNRQEAWITDGTAAGTSLLARAWPDCDDASCAASGGELPIPRLAVEVAGGAVFSAVADTDVSQLWFTDGTAAGTRPLRDFVTGDDFAGSAVDALPRNTTAFAGRVFFVAFDDASGGWGLWTSDGTSAGTRLVHAVEGVGVEAPLHHLAAAGGSLLYFQRHGFSDTLWAVDGTADETRRVTHLTDQGHPVAVGRAYVPPAPASPRSGDAAVADGRLYFVASSRASGEELWTSDGTAHGTFLLADLVPGPGGSSPANLEAVAGQVLFSALGEDTGREPWSIVRGSPALLQDLAPGPWSSFPAHFTQAGDAIYFAARTPAAGSELWAIADLALLVDAAGVCSGAVHCFQDGRFRVAVRWDDGQRIGTARPVPGASDDSGLFTFFSADNWEMLVKVLDGCAIDGSYWVFAAAATNVGYELEVTDLETGERRVYTKAFGPPAPALTATGAFACSP